jgi:hypothetical protein
MRYCHCEGSCGGQTSLPALSPTSTLESSPKRRILISLRLKLIFLTASATFAILGLPIKLVEHWLHCVLLLTLAEKGKATIICNCKDALWSSLCLSARPRYVAQAILITKGSTACPNNTVGPEFNQRSFIDVGEEDEGEEEVIACYGPCLGL